MELKEFVKQVLVDLTKAVEEGRKETGRGMYLTGSKDSNRSVEFDIAVTVHDTEGAKGSGGIKVFQMIEGGGEMTKETINSTVSRVKFGISVNNLSDAEVSRGRQDFIN